MTRPWLRRSVALLVTTIVTLLAVEQCYRVYLFGGSAFSAEQMNSVHPMGDSGLLRRSAIPEIAFELKPNAEARFKLATVKTNSVGLRDEERSLEKPNGVYRIAVIGDSYTLPAGVEIEEAYHQVLERELARVHAPREFDCLNFGVGGYALRQYCAVLEHRALPYQPDLVLVGFCIENDHKVPPDSLFEGAWQARPETRPFLSSFLVEQLRRRSRRAQRATSDAAVFTPREVEYLERHFAELARQSTESEVPIVVIGLSHLAKPEYMQRLRTLVEASGLRFLDVSGRFTEARPFEHWIYRTDKHPNAVAHSMFADAIREYLETEGLLNGTD